MALAYYEVLRAESATQTVAIGQGPPRAAIHSAGSDRDSVEGVCAFYYPAAAQLGPAAQRGTKRRVDSGFDRLEAAVGLLGIAGQDLFQGRDL